MPWQAPNHKVIQSFDHVVLQGHMANKNHYISIATKLGRMMASLDGLLPIISHDPLIMQSYEIWGSLTGGGSKRKCFSPHRHLVKNCFHWCAKPLLFRRFWIIQSLIKNPLCKKISYLWIPFDICFFHLQATPCW